MMKSVLRLILNTIYLISHKTFKNKGYRVLIRSKFKGMLTRTLFSCLLSVNHLDFIMTILYAAAAAYKGCAYLEAAVITFDILCVGYFQYLLISIYMKSSTQPYKKTDFNSIKERLLIELSFIFHSNGQLSIPVTLTQNFNGFFRILILFMLKDYPQTFAVVFCGFNVFACYFWITRLKSKFYTKLIFLVKLLILVETSFFCAISCLPLSTSLLENDSYDTLLVAIFLTWIFYSFFTTVMLYVTDCSCSTTWRLRFKIPPVASRWPKSGL